MTQKSYRQRREEAGYRYVSLWMTKAQEDIVKSMLRIMEESGMVPAVDLMQRGGWRPRKGKTVTEPGAGGIDKKPVL